MGSVRCGASRVGVAEEGRQRSQAERATQDRGEAAREQHEGGGGFDQLGGVPENLWREGSSSTREEEDSMSVVVTGNVERSQCVDS